MAFTRTLTQVSDRVQYLADIRGQVAASSSARHPQADVFEVISDAYRSLAIKTMELGFTELLASTTIANLPTTVASGDTGEQFARVASPSGAISVRGVDVLKDGQIWRSLDRVTWEQRRNDRLRCDDNGLPNYWCEVSLGSVSATTFTAGSIAIFPLPRRAVPYRIWYLPEPAALSDGTHLFLYADQNWHDWHVARAAWQIASIRDNDGKRRAASLLAMQMAAEGAMAAAVSKRQQDQPLTVMRSPSYNW